MQARTLAFLLGVSLVQLQASLPGVIWLSAAFALSLLLLTLNRSTGLLAVAFTVGLAWATLYAEHRLDDAIPDGLEGEEVVVTGVVASLPEHSPRRSRFLFEVDSLEHAGEHHDTPSLVRLSWYEKAPPLLPGQRWQMKVKLKRPHGMLNPGGFDYEQWLFQQGIRATGYVRHGEENRLLGQSWYVSSVEQVRYQLQQRLGETLAHEEFGGLLRALAIGDRSGISDEQWSLLLDTGT
ncbi:MAG: DUF4131 domain-containing protein, partial [Chromatiales bacterium]|nr:DUF4131 domain-containing protein [Chromatiales bacterium]